MKALGSSVNSARSRSYSRGVRQYGPKPLGPGLSPPSLRLTLGRVSWWGTGPLLLELLQSEWL